MAVYFNLVVDCGPSAEVAERVRQSFDGHQFDHSPLAPLQCSAFTSQARGKWFAGVQPRGLGYGTIPQSENRAELVKEPHLGRIREQLYAHLAGVEGFERACFGAEVWDTFALEEEPIADPWWRDMIIAERLVAGRFPPVDFIRFAPGYLRWVPREPELELPEGWVRGEEGTGWPFSGTIPGAAGAADFDFNFGRGVWTHGGRSWYSKCRRRLEELASVTTPLRSEALPVPELHVTLFELAGTLRPQAAPDGAAAAPGAAALAQAVTRLLGAHVEAAGWEWFLQVSGPDATVAAARHSFVAMLQGMRRS